MNKLLRASVDLVLDASLALEAQTFRTDDHREAVRAFVEKRTPSSAAVSQRVGPK